MNASVNEFLAGAKTHVRFNNFGQYLLPDPHTGKEKAWTRATTFADAVKSSFALNRWKCRMLARGLVLRPDLQATIASEWDDNAALDKAIEEAQEHAGSTVGANYGNALHAFTEIIDGGEEPPVIPEHLLPDVIAYREAMAAAHLTSLAIERIVCLPDLGVAGKLDRILTPAGSGLAYIGDVKSGQDLSYAITEIVIQLALYANAEFMWMGDGWEPMLPVEKDRAIVMHIPATKGICTLYWVDIASGWEAAQLLCAPVRKWRNRKDLLIPFEPSAPSPPGGAVEGPVPGPSVPQAGEAPGDRADWITTRLMALSSNERARDLVGQAWPDGVTVQPPWTGAQIDRLAKMLDDVEAEVGQGFGASDPDTPVPELKPPEPPAPDQRVPPWDVLDAGVKAADEDVAGLAHVVQNMMSGTQQERLLGWMRQAKHVDRPIDGAPMTQRQWLCARAAISLVRHLDDDESLVRGAIVAVVGQWEQGWTVGAVIGSLSDTQAERLADLADAYGSGDKSAFDPF